MPLLVHTEIQKIGHGEQKLKVPDPKVMVPFHLGITLLIVHLAVSNCLAQIRKPIFLLVIRISFTDGLVCIQPIQKERKQKITKPNSITLTTCSHTEGSTWEASLFHRIITDHYILKRDVPLWVMGSTHGRDITKLKFLASLFREIIL